MPKTKTGKPSPKTKPKPRGRPPKEKAAAPDDSDKMRRGFSAMDPETQRDIARKGGKTIAKRKGHMAKIGAIGGSRSKANRTYAKAA